MRVTNETANRISVLCKKQNETDSCYGCRYDDIKYEFCPATWNAPNLSLDLLDARKIIDEQTALIREMVSELKDIESLAETRTIKGELVYVSSFKEIRDLLEKSKDYV